MDGGGAEDASADVRSSAASLLPDRGQFRYFAQKYSGAIIFLQRKLTAVAGNYFFLLWQVNKLIFHNF